jgi:hypothetical protein
MNTYHEYRKSRRFEHNATVMLENETNGYFSYGLMMNYSSGGMCIGSDAAYNKGAEIRIRFGQPLYKAAPTTYSGTVRWCKELARDDFDYSYSYGVGIKYD